MTSVNSSPIPSMRSIILDTYGHGRSHSFSPSKGKLSPSIERRNGKFRTPVKASPPEDTKKDVDDENQSGSGTQKSERSPEQVEKGKHGKPESEQGKPFTFQRKSITPTASPTRLSSSHKLPTTRSSSEISDLDNSDNIELSNSVKKTYASKKIKIKKRKQNNKKSEKNFRAIRKIGKIGKIRIFREITGGIISG